MVTPVQHENDRKLNTPRTIQGRVLYHAIQGDVRYLPKNIIILETIQR